MASLAAALTILLSVFVIAIALWQFRRSNSFKEGSLRDADRYEEQPVYPPLDFLYFVNCHDNSYTLPIGLYNLVNEVMGASYTTFATGALLISIPIAIIFLLLHKNFVSGLTAGGTKG